MQTLNTVQLDNRCDTSSGLACRLDCLTQLEMLVTAAGARYNMACSPQLTVAMGPPIGPIQVFCERHDFSARDVIYTSRAYATMSVSVCLSVRLSVTEVHWRIIANLGFKFRSKFTAHCGRGEG